MNLPPLSIPDFPLPFAIPEMMHPAIVHFAVALPVVILLLEIINLLVRRKSIGSISFVLIALMVVVYLGAYLTGTADAHDVKNTLMPETKAMLDAHTNGGIWLVYGSVAVLFFKLISASVKKFLARVVFLAVLGLFFWGATGVTQKGCALVYKHGVNVHKDAATTATTQPATEAPKETVADSVKKAEEAAKEITQKAEEKVAEAEEKVEEKAAEVVEKVEEKAAETVEKAKEKTTEAVKTVDEKTSEAAQKADEAVQKAVESAPQTPATETPAQPTTPVETVPAG